MKNMNQEGLKYQKLYNWAHTLITSGVIKSMDKFPSETSLQKKFGYSRQTVRTALQQLEEEGLITRVRGSGTYVSATLINYDSTGFKVACTVVVLVIGFIAFRYTKFGTYLKAIGAGEKAAMFSGIRTDRMKFLMYVLAGALTGFAAFINVIKVGSVTSSGGNQLETQILIALVLGGMPISGGAKVRFENIVVGSLLYVVLNSGLTMMGFSTQMMQLIQGVVFLIFVAVFADRESLTVIK